MEVPPLVTPPTDDGITDDRLKRVRSMLFAALNKVVVQAKILQMSMHEAPSSDPRLVPMLERVHLIVSALQTSASLPTHQQQQHTET